MKVSFMEIAVSPQENQLKKYFNLSGFRRGQKEIIDSVMGGRDVLAVLPTGGGKSLCYQYPAVVTQKLVIVISPLIALMKDQVASLRRYGIPAGALHSGQSDDDKREVFAEINKGGAFVLYLSPERAQKEGFHRWVQNRQVGLFAIDEAHCVSQWGHDFREEYAQLNVLKKLCPDVPVLALTASATPTVLDDISKHLKLQKPERMVHGFYRSNLYYQVELCEDEDVKLLLLLQSIKQTPEGRIIVYCGTRKVTESIAAFLQKKFGKSVGYYHAGLTSDVRTSTQEAYAKGDLRILVATNAFGMGIDQPDVRLVVHFQIPANIDALYQEMGRAGRDGEHSTCLTLYSKKDKGLQSFFIHSSEAPDEIKDARWRNLDALVNYSEGGECRHAEILTYYKDSQRIERCGHCDSCDPKSSRRIQKSVTPLAKMDQVVTKLKKASSKSKKITNTDDIVLDEIQEKRMELLKRWRREKAKELDVPAFVVFGDLTLRQLAVKNPRTLDEMKNIYGIGDSKLEKFGWDILAELGDPTRRR